jgi:hypothetical protein
MKTICFYTPHFTVRGTEVALYDYAHYNEKILGNKSIIVHHKNDSRNEAESVSKFKNRFDVVSMEGFNYIENNPRAHAPEVVTQLNKVIEANKADAMYLIKGGWNDGIVPTACKSLIHCCGLPPVTEKHGDRYAYVSYWCSQHCSNGSIPAVPHMVDLPDINEDFRSELNIPQNATVFGRSGGYDTFDIPWTKQIIQEVLKQRSDIFFIFLNTEKFIDHPNVIHLGKNTDLIYKTKFINTCDAMLHSRFIGESFGLSCGEFSIRNKPVITWFGSKERNHIYILGDRGIYYNNPIDLFKILINYNREHYLNKDNNCYRDYSPEKIINVFDEVYLK